MKWYICHDADWNQYIFESDKSPGTISDGSPFVMVYPYKTLDLLLEDILDCQCKVCGNFIQFHFMEPVKTEIITKQLCYSCNLWDKRAKSISDKHCIVDGQWYTLNFENTIFRGFGGAKFVFMKGDKVIECTNVWYGGKIPDIWRSKIPNNAIILKL